MTQSPLSIYQESVKKTFSGLKTDIHQLNDHVQALKNRLAVAGNLSTADEGSLDQIVNEAVTITGKVNSILIPPAPLPAGS